MSGHFRHSVWDPVLIVSQILTVQCMFYASLCFITALICTLGHHSPALTYLFDFREINVKTAFGISIALGHLVNTAFGAVYLWLIVQRAKPCLDYAITTYTLHLLMCCAYNGQIPTTFSWWVVNAICGAAMCICGELLCVRTEMKAIPLISQKCDV